MAKQKWRWLFAREKNIARSIDTDSIIDAFKSKKGWQAQFRTPRLDRLQQVDTYSFGYKFFFYFEYYAIVD